MGRRIAIVGASSAGFRQLSSLVKERYISEKYKDDEYYLIHDPDKVHRHMWSGTTPSFFDELNEVTTMSRRWLQKYCDAVDCQGQKFIGWGKAKKNFTLGYRSQCAQHFDIDKFRQAWIQDGGQGFGDNVYIREQTVDSVSINASGCLLNGEEFDYIIDCCDKEPLGWEDDYCAPSFQFVDTAFIVEKPIKGDWDFTIEYAAKYGHITGIPLQDKQLWIYFYDNISRKDTTDKELLKEFADIFPDEDVTKYKHETINWIPKISNYVIHPHNGRYIRNGNSLVHVESLSGTYHECHQVMADSIDRYLFWTGEDEDINEVKAHVQETFYDLLGVSYQTMLAFLYQYGSRYKTKFWKKAAEEAAIYLEGDRFLHPSYFPGHKWRDEVLNDKWTWKDYRKLIRLGGETEDIGGRQLIMPFVIMNDYTLFAELAIGLGAGYADRFRTLDLVEPPEPFGTIGYNYY
jgi:hypothetical protein